ncbi:MAG: BioY family protein [Methanomassiliicoccales archaeon PtaU1.Bin124]|nr:MAG: BioY family protein [Methanomassiliicoccales archaeon PtaU1.Bin124]
MYLPAYREMRGVASGTLFRWRNETSWPIKTLAAFFFAVLMALAAQMRLVMPFSPVPFTGQVLVVLVAAVCLGRFGAVSQVMYVGMGAGLGWFSGMVGTAALLSVTGGYLIGFVLAALFLGELVERRSSWSVGRLSLAMCAAVGIIYACGVIQMALVLHMDLVHAIMIGAVPFVVVDGLKIAMAAGLCSVLVPARE